MKILIAAGGSGGHLLPAQQLAHELKNQADVLFAGHKLDASPFFDRKRFSYQSISAAPIRFSLRGVMRFVFFAMRGIFQSVRLIVRYRPDVVVGFGSFHTFPVLAAAWLTRRKIVLFEANCLLGKVNRLFAGNARIIGVQFSLRKDYKKVSFVPMLPWGNEKELPDRIKAKNELGLSNNAPVFLVFGGSQGAAFLNREIPHIMPTDAQVIHLAGNDAAVQAVERLYAKNDIFAIVKAFEKDMPKLYAAADFVICRSGASTLGELIRYEKPALLIPFPSAADDHQTINAEFLAKKIKGATILFEREAGRVALTDKIEELKRDAGAYQKALILLKQESAGRMSLSQQIVQMRG
jgi:UDP-N-acetylglucosamine--N-acetylmuramyl-(pentapeptide) pyrophosphoryl-undecaprenol N-acetylglucosamine transferase